MAEHGRRAHYVHGCRHPRCVKANSDYQRAYYAEHRAHPRELLPCGTNAGYERHRRKGERMDKACRLAHNAYCLAEIKRRARAIKNWPYLAVHGKYTTYDNWGCRCAPCSKAKSVENAKTKRRLRGRAA